MWILAVAREVSSWNGAVSHVGAPPAWALPAVVLGLLVVILWQGRWRLAGLALPVVALLGWSQTERPDVLISDSAGLVGVMTPEGRALSKPRGEGFAATNWLENDGDGADQPGAHARNGFAGDRGQLRFEIAGLRAVHLSGRGASDRLAEACRGADLVILAARAEAPAGCRVIDRTRLAADGAAALYLDGGTVRMVTVADRSGRRPWNAVQ